MAIKKRVLTEYGKAIGVNRANSWEELLLAIIKKVSLTEAQYKVMEGRYDEMARIIDSSSNPMFTGAKIYPQGSILSRTVIRTPNGEIDVDAITWLPNAPSDKPLTVLDALHTEFSDRSRVSEDIEMKNRCVRIHYADSKPAFHMDVTPARNAPDNTAQDGSGQLVVPDRRTHSWKPSNPKGFASWLNTVADKKIQVALNFTERLLAKADSEDLPSHEQLTTFDPLRGSIKLMKLHRDLMFSDPEDAALKPISVLITTLAGKAYLKVVAESQGDALTPLDALRRIIAYMPSCFDKTPQAGGTWLLKNPADTTAIPENFAERWNGEPALVAAFREWHADLTVAVDLGMFDFPEVADFEESLGKAFGDSTIALARESLSEAVRLGHEPAGLSQEGLRRHRNRSATTAVFGQDLSAPRAKPQEPKSLDRLG